MIAIRGLGLRTRSSGTSELDAHLSSLEKSIIPTMAIGMGAAITRDRGRRATLHLPCYRPSRTTLPIAHC